MTTLNRMLAMIDGVIGAQPNAPEATQPIAGCTNAEVDRLERNLMLITQAMSEPVAPIDLGTAKTRVLREMRA